MSRVNGPLVQERNRTFNVQILGLTFAEAAHTRTFWIFCLTSIIMGFVGQVVMVHIVAHATDIGFEAAAATILSVIGLVSIFGKIFMGGMADMSGNRNVMIMFYTLCAVAYIWIRFAGELWMLYFLTGMEPWVLTWQVISLIPPAVISWLSCSASFSASSV